MSDFDGCRKMHILIIQIQKVYALNVGDNTNLINNIYRFEGL